MSVSTPLKVTVGSGVPEFLRANDAEGDFQAICDIVRECFPHAVAVEARLQEDHDEPGWWRVVLDMSLSHIESADAWVDQSRRYCELLVDRAPPPRNMLFTMLHEYLPE